MPQQLIFVRHGETTYNVEGRLMGWVRDHAILTGNGHNQAATVARALTSYTIDHIYHSDLIRTTETAKIICHALGKLATPTPFLRERNLGNFADRTWDDIKTNSPGDWKKFLDHHDPDWNGLEGESLTDVATRYKNFLPHLHTHHQNQTVLLITHSGFIHTVLRDVYGFFPIESFAEVSHSSLTILEKQGNTYQLKLYNQIS